jgi:hypothetical protein
MKKPMPKPLAIRAADAVMRPFRRYDLSRWPRVARIHCARPCKVSEHALARQLFPAFKPDMLVIADRLFYGYDMWREDRVCIESDASPLCDCKVNGIGASCYKSS